MYKTMGGKRFVEWDEQFVSHDRGSRVVHYYLKDQNGNAVLAVVGTERSLRHMVYVVSEEFLHLPGLAKPTNSSFKWRSRREVVDWLSSLLWKPRPSTTSSGDYVTKSNRHESSRVSDTDLSNGEDMDELDSYVNNNKDKFSRRIRSASKGITWLGSSWTCRKRLRHYESFRRSGITISVNDYVYVMAEEKIHHIAYLEDMYEDKKGQKKVRVRWFHRTNEVVGSIPPPLAHEAEVFITPFRQVLSVECVDGQATILTPDHYEKCLSKFPFQVVAQIHVCFRQFDNEGIKSFNLNEMQGYWHQKILKSIDFAYPQDYSKHELSSDSFDLDEEDTTNGTARNKYPRRNRCTRRRIGVSNRACLGNSEEKNRAMTGHSYRPALDGGMCEQQSMCFNVGDNIELLCQDSGIRGCWFRCTIIKKVPYRFKVWYKDVLNEDGNDHLEEWVSSFGKAIPDKLGMRIAGRPTIRPCAPEDRLGSFEVGTVVDAWWNDGWWEGVVVMINELSDELQVFFPGENVYSEFKMDDLRPSREWINNRWTDLDNDTDVGAKLVSCDSRQKGSDSGTLQLSTFSKDHSFYIAPGELGDYIDLSLRKLCIISQVAARESEKLEMVRKTQNGDDNMLTVDVKEEEMSEVACGDCDDPVNALASKNMRTHESFSNTDTSRNLISNQSGLDNCSDHISSVILESNNRETCSPRIDRLRRGLRWKSSKKRQRPGDSALLSRSATSCGKEESKRICTGKLVDTPDLKNGNECVQASSNNMPKGQGDMMDTSASKQGHDSLKPIHGASISDTIFMSSMPVANLVMSR